MLLDSELKREYETLHKDIEDAKKRPLRRLQEISGLGRKRSIDLEREISLFFTRSETRFLDALVRIKEEVIEQNDAPFSYVDYHQVFNEEIKALLKTQEFKDAIQSYIERYNKLLSTSTFFKKGDCGNFNDYNASTAAKTLKDNNYFKADHILTLNRSSGTTVKSIETVEQLEELIETEKKELSKIQN